MIKEGEKYVTDVKLIHNQVMNIFTGFKGCNQIS